MEASDPGRCTRRDFLKAAALSAAALAVDAARAQTPAPMNTSANAPRFRPLTAAEHQELVALAAGLDPVFRFAGAA